MWYAQNKQELNNVLDDFLNQKNENVKNPGINSRACSGFLSTSRIPFAFLRTKIGSLRKRNSLSIKNLKNIHGIIVPHAGYEYSGAIAGKAFALFKNKNTDIKRALILAPNHYKYFKGTLTHSEKYWQTPLGDIKVIDSDFNKINLKQEHSIDNQIPFLQKLGVKEILPLSIGEITLREAEEIANKIKDFNGIFIVSSDLSHFNNQEKANLLDKRTIKIIENLEFNNINKIDACGIYPLIVLMQLCKIKNWKLNLLEYKTSGDVIGDFSSVVGYGSLYF